MDDFSAYVLSTSLPTPDEPKEPQAASVERHQVTSPSTSAQPQASASTSGPSSSTAPLTASFELPSGQSTAEADSDALTHLLTHSSDWYTKDISEFKDAVHFDKLYAALKKQSDHIPHYTKQDLQQLAETVSKDASQRADVVMRGLVQIKNTLQSQGDKLEHILQRASLASEDSPHHPPNSSSPSRLADPDNHTTTTAAGTGPTETKPSIGAGTRTAPTPTLAAASSAVQGTFQGLFGGFSRSALTTQVRKTESTVSRWGLGLSSFIQQAITIEVPEDDGSFTAASSNQTQNPGVSTTTGFSNRLSSKSLGKQPALGRTDSSSALVALQKRRLERLAQLQADRCTYTADPATTAQKGAFGSFADSFDPTVEPWVSTIRSLLTDTIAIAQLHNELVNSNQLSDATFWSRYFFRAQELERQEKVREQLISGKAAGTGEGGGRASMDSPGIGPLHSAPPEGTTSPRQSSDLSARKADASAPTSTSPADLATLAKTSPDSTVDFEWGSDDDDNDDAGNANRLSTDKDTANQQGFVEATTPLAKGAGSPAQVLDDSPTIQSISSSASLESPPLVGSPDKAVVAAASSAEITPATKPSDTSSQPDQKIPPSTTTKVDTATTNTKKENGGSAEDDDDWGNWE
ncbi:hypothetical protein H4R33_005781 [Dimargaris cristalligena]|nr:hypothetical protein H4R33_005781 [Dimargaris cristalligena]